MKDTIKAKNGYTVKQCIKKGQANTQSIPIYGKVFDGDKLLFIAQYRSLDDYNDECKNKSNECAVKYEIFTTVKGNQFIYWGDEETGEDFLTKVTR